MTPFFAIIFIWAFTYVATLLLYWQGWSKGRARVGASEQEKKGVSIVVPFRNETQNLPACIASLKTLDYPKDLFEIIFVDDHSTDASAESARSAGEILLELDDNESGKKAALTKAISSAKFSTILTLDADSVVNTQWLNTMVKTMQSGNFLAIGGLVIYKKEEGFLNAFLNVEMCSLMGMTAGGINNKKPLLANGTNLMFSKEAFLEVKGYEGDVYSSGDDVFLVQKIAKKFGANRIGFNNEEESIVATQGVTSLSALFHQRARWAAKSKAYSSARKFTTILLGSFNILIALLIILAVFKPHMIPFVFAMFFLKLAADTILTLPVLLRTNQIYLIKYLIPVALLYPFYILGTALLSFFIKPVWKGRSV